MKFFEHLLAQNPTTPRLTIYAGDSRLDFSAQTLDNWTSKIANMLLEELDLEPGSSRIVVDLPVSWQAAVVIFGALSVGIHCGFAGEGDAVFTSLSRTSAHKGEVLVVSDDPFGRGVVESGGTLPEGTLDFGPIVRFYGDQFFGESQALPELLTPSTPDRFLTTGWGDYASFEHKILAPLAAGGSVVVVADDLGEERLAEIAAAEKTTAQA